MIRLLLFAILTIVDAAQYNDLQKWLPNLELTVKDIHYNGSLTLGPLGHLQILLDLSKLQCYSIEIDSLASERGLQKDELNLWLNGFGINCTMNFGFDVVMGDSDIQVENVDMFIYIYDTWINLKTLLEVDGIDPTVPLNYNVTHANTSINLMIASNSTFLNDISGLAIGGLKAAAPELIKGLLENSLTKLFRTWGPLRADPEPIVPDGMMVWQQASSIPNVLHTIIKLYGPPLFNTLVKYLTGGTGSFVLSNLTFPLHIKGIGDIKLGLQHLNLSGLDTVADLDMVVPVRQHSFSHTIKVSNIGLNLVGFLELNLTGPGNASTKLEVIAPSLREEFGLKLATPVQIDLISLVAVEKAVLGALKGSQFVDLGCVLPSLYNISLQQLAANITPSVFELSHTGHQLEDEIGTLLTEGVELLRDVAPVALTGPLGGLFKDLRRYFNDAVKLLLEGAKARYTTCHSPQQSEDQQRVDTQRVQGEWVESSFAVLVLISAIGMIIYHRKCGFDKEDSYLLHPQASCLCLSSKLHPAIRITMPLLVCGNIVLFISSNTGVGAAVKLQGTFGSEKLQLATLFNFSLSNTIHDMWQAKVYPLALLIAVFSGCWPYVKLLLMLFCWFIPSTILPLHRRRSILHWVDVLGKWSLIDAFVLVMMVVAFRFHIALPGGTDSNPADIDVMVEPQWGFYSFLLATQISLILGHLMVYFQRKTETEPDYEIPSFPSNSTPKHIIQDRDYDMEEAHPLRSFSRWEAWYSDLLIVLLLLASGVILVLGASMDSFAFNFKGAAGYVLGDKSTRNFSLFSLGLTMKDSSEYPDSFPVRWIQATFFIFAFAVPLAHIVFMIGLWFIPLKKDTQRKFYIATGVFDAWVALEVFVLSLVASILEIGQLAKFIVGSRCSEIDKLLKQFMDKQLKGDDTCFDVSCTLSNGCWMLLSAAIVLAIVARFVMSVCGEAVETRESHYRISMKKQPSA